MKNSFEIIDLYSFLCLIHAPDMCVVINKTYMMENGDEEQYSKRSRFNQGCLCFCKYMSV